MTDRIVIAPGANVDLGNGLIGKVLEVCVKESSERYREVWWNGTTRVVAWFEPNKLKCAQVRKSVVVCFVKLKCPVR
jgi:hypothetical protein